MPALTASDATFCRSLEELGLSNHESRAYITLLSRGASTISEIARGSSIKRTTCYTVLEGLRQRGYVSLVPRGRTLKYVASHPEALSSVLSSRLDNFNALLPQLKALYNLSGATGSTRIFDGMEAIKEVYELLLRSAKPGEPYLVMANVERWHRLAPKYFSSFVERRSRLGLNPRHLFSTSPVAEEWSKRMRKLGAQARILPGSMSFSINLVIIPRLVVIHQLVDPVQAVVIESPLVAEMLKQIYEVVWASVPEML